jgi:uncharacterized protein YodC (DUF2158 family)
MIKLGSVVQLKSGGPLMTVTYTDMQYSSHTIKGSYENNGVECIWHNSASEKVSAIFIPDCLQEVTNKKKAN